ncbi:hypothetical protein DFJ74DRAFT_215237 [Hyaloraphidium curvatum]|nr:hypothetical protein DFJ74DRAFT_215237 [Hyaloraphidium curvatum]
MAWLNDLAHRIRTSWRLGGLAFFAGLLCARLLIGSSDAPFPTPKLCRAALTEFEECLLRERNESSIEALLPPPPVLKAGGASKADIETIVSHILAYSKAMRSLESGSHACRQRTLLYRCTEEGCGGLGDRIRGMILVFYWALLSGSRFGLSFEFPVSLSAYFEAPFPESLPLFGVSPNSTDEKHLNFIYHFPSFGSRGLNQLLGNEAVVDVVTNGQVWRHLLENAEYEGRGRAFFPYLYSLNKLQMAHVALILLVSKPTQYLQSAVNQYLGRRASSGSTAKVGLQLRHGDHAILPEQAAFWNATQVSRRRLVKRVGDASLSCFAKKAASICLELTDKKSCSFFITSDSKRAFSFLQHRLATLLEGKKQHSVFQTDGHAVHIDKPPKSSLAAQDRRIVFLKSFVDWTLLSRMDVLLISPSGFGKTPAWLSYVETYMIDATPAGQENCVWHSYFEHVQGDAW